MDNDDKSIPDLGNAELGESAEGGVPLKVFSLKLEDDELAQGHDRSSAEDAGAGRKLKRPVSLDDIEPSYDGEMLDKAPSMTSSHGMGMDANQENQDGENIPHGELEEEGEIVENENADMDIINIKALFIQPESPREDREQQAIEMIDRAVPKVELLTAHSAGAEFMKEDVQIESDMGSRFESSDEETKEQSAPGMSELKIIKKTKNRRQSRQDSMEAPREAVEFLAEEGMAQGPDVADSSDNITGASAECARSGKPNDPYTRFMAFLTRKREGEKTYCFNLTVTRILILMILLSSILGFILFLGLFPPSVVYISYFEIGLRQSKLTNYLDRDTVYYPGCYVLRPDSKFLYFPSTAQDVTLQINVFTTDTVIISIRFNLQYFIRPGEVGQLHLKYGVDYDDVIRKVIVAVIKNEAATGVAVDHFRFNRTAVERKFLNALKLKLEGNCCPSCCITGCKGDSFCGLCLSEGSCHHGYHINIHNFCLLDVKIPGEVLERYLRRVILQVQAETEVFSQERAVLLNETAMLTQRFHNAANEIIANSSAVGDAVRTIATAEQENVYQSAYSRALKSLFTTLRVTNESHKVSLMMIRTLEDVSDNLYIGYGYNVSYLYLNQ